MDELLNDDRIILYTSTDAYNEDFFITNFLNKNIKCDFILDDGPHTLESVKQFIKVYDLRENKNCSDDIVFTIDKSNI
uniref:Uncharacterized protein n=1 Tax=viral metagenome TaxID=1070528 RepID=A0A6C0CUX8_9ZZZZ